MNTERESIASALRELSKSSRRNKTAQLREIFDEVESAKAAGVSNKVIVETLQKNGIYYDVNNFKNARSRILKERALAALSNATGNANVVVPTNISVMQIAAIPSNQTKEQPNKKAQDLIRPQGITDSEWKDMKVKHLTSFRKTT